MENFEKAPSKVALITLMCTTLLSGCASYGVVVNEPAERQSTPEKRYTMKAVVRGTERSDDISFMISFSGGGTRAAALAYGVLLELRETQTTHGGDARALLDEVDLISSVSGGSFTSAYYGLYGDKIFEDFEAEFLRQDFQATLIRGLFNPGYWFSSRGRTEMAVSLYDDNIFHGATFDDLSTRNAPFIIINASDLGYGARFSFIQEYFDVLCSDISDYPIARAVAASSAVPVLFNPVVVRNYSDCDTDLPDWFIAAKERSLSDIQLAEMVEDVESFFLSKDRDYIHFIDGGITDNLGLRAIYEIVELNGGALMTYKNSDRPLPSRAVVISVDASTTRHRAFDRSAKRPSIADTVGSISGIQLHRYNTATLDLMDKTIKRWAKEASTASHDITPYFIRLGFRDLKDEASIDYFNGVPTSFNLSDEQVDRLIQAGRELLRDNPDFQKLVADLSH